MSDEKKIYPKIETGYAFTKDMNDDLVKKLLKVISHKQVKF